MMEKKSYVKPVIKSNELKTNSLIAGSMSFDVNDEDNTFAEILDNCFRVRVKINNTSYEDVTNEQIAGYFINNNVSSVCLNKHNTGCTITEDLKNYSSWKITYNGTTFSISDGGCSPTIETLSYNTNNY